MKLRAIIENSNDNEVFMTCDNVSVILYRKVKTEISEVDNLIHHKPDGDPIILVTSNMPTDLHESIDKLINQYCEGNNNVNL